MSKVQKYRVTAPSKVFGVSPGDTFERELEPIQEARLLDSGAISKVAPKKAAKSPEQSAPTDEKDVD